MPPTTRLPDADSRQVVTASLSRNLFVEAGAGSGKTSSLVTRIVNMVASGIPVGQIAAITFTEAAARELRTRVRDELEHQGLAQQDRHLHAASGLVERAAFTTLHGFALRLLADHPVEAGLPPGFAVADEIASMLEFDESWRLFTGQVGDDLDLLDLQERAAVLGVELRRFVDIARRFDDNWDLLDGVDRSPAPLSPVNISETLDEVAGLADLVDNCLSDADKLAEGLLRLAEAAERLRSQDPLSQLELLDELPWPSRRAGRKDNWVRLDVDKARHEVELVRTQVGETVDRYRVEVIEHFVALVADFVAQRVADRSERGQLAYHDLLVLARRLLRSHPGVRAELHQRYRRLLLDEFQDTDPIQIELAVLLAADSSVEVGDRPWTELAADLEPGRLVVVGDPKQSIYRFRRADFGVYADTEAALVDEPERLSSNFRSVPGVVEWVNGFFTEAIGEGDDRGQPRYQPLDAIRTADPQRPVPVLALGGPHERSVSVGEIRELEATEIAAVVCRAMEEGWRVERDGQWRPVRLQDIAVLIPSRLSLPALESAFGVANIPFRPETSSLVYATQEVRDVLAGVRAVVDPSSSVDVVAALRSGLFAVDDNDLLSWRLADRSWDYTISRERSDSDTGDDHPVAAAFEVLERWHVERWWADPSALIERIVTERRLREAALAEPRPRDRWRRYRFLAEQAREFTATTGGDLHDFVAWVEIQSSDLARVTEPIPAEPDDDAVRVLTVHGSKGLEFPMVILAGAPTREMNRVAGAQVIFPATSAPEVKLSKGKSTQFFDIHASVEEVLDRHERVRLQYVAATRARDLLVVSAHHKEGLTSSGARMHEGLLACPDLWRPFEIDPEEAAAARYRVEPPTQLRLAGGDFDETAAAWEAERATAEAATAAARTYSATAVAASLSPEPAAVPADLDLGDREPDDARRGRAGTAIGTAVHATLQVIDFGQPATAEALAAFNAEAEGIGERAAEVASHVVAALSSPAVELARTRRHWRELYVAVPVGEGLVEGYVDLCVEGPDGLIVVDYKTDLVASEAEIDAKLASYRYQAATYALALGRLTGQPVVECRFVFLSPDGVVERSVDDLAAVIAEVEAHVNSAAAVEASG